VTDSKETIRLKVIVPVLSLALAAAFGLIGWAWWSSHQQACRSRNQTLNVLRDVIVIATTPDRKQHPSAEQIREINAFRAAAIGRIDKARC